MSSDEDVGVPEMLRICDSLHMDLMQECKHSPPGARLSARLRSALERMSPKVRKKLVTRTFNGCPPLFLACKRGNLEIVEYLVHVCGADVEQRGVYEVTDDRSLHHVTPLWCAAVAGRLNVLQALADAGANINAGSDTGSSPVRSACFMTNLEVVRFLVERGADIHRPNFNGGTCLINSVQSVRLCTLLLEHGAELDAYDMQHKTALLYAIQEHRLETTRLLLQYNASPYIRSLFGDDALQTACIKGAVQIVELLAETFPYTASRLADAYDLLGSTQLDELNDVSAALMQWRKALNLRAETGATKELATPLEALGFAREFTNLQQLEAATGDIDALRIQSLLICGRVLGMHHKDSLYRLMYRGSVYADAFQYQRCIDLWIYALKIRIERDSLLSSDTCHTACALTRLMLDAHNGRLERSRSIPRYKDVIAVFSLLANNLPQARRDLDVRPLYKKQAETFDRVMRCLTHLLNLTLQTIEGCNREERLIEIYDKLRWLVSQNVRSIHTGDTLLHLCMSRLNVIRSNYFSDELEANTGFPSLLCAQALIDCGIDVNMRNETCSTALHVASIPYNFSTELVETLLAGGAHIDTPNKFGDSPLCLIVTNTNSRVCPLNYQTLACLAAASIIRHEIQVPPEALPHTLKDFLRLHTP